MKKLLNSIKKESTVKEFPPIIITMTTAGTNSGKVPAGSKTKNKPKK